MQMVIVSVNEVAVNPVIEVRALIAAVNATASSVGVAYTVKGAT